MSTEIFVPVFYMFILTSAVFLFNTTIRFKDVLIDKGHRASELFKIPVASSASDLIRQGDRNLINLFEFPIFSTQFVLFYMLLGKSMIILFY